MWGNATYNFHIGAWASWLGAAMLMALSTRNPFYLALVMVMATMVNWAISHHATISGDDAGTMLGSNGPEPSVSNARGLLLRAVIGLAFVVALLKGFSYHIGATVLFSLPDNLPVIGGPVTAEGLAAAGLDGLSILTVLAVFTAFSAGADYYAMLRSVPAFMHQVALVTSIAITFVPQTVTRFGEIREAQTLRGHRVRRIGDLVPLIMPLLAGGMERSMNLAEAMEARGFSRSAPPERHVPAVVVQIGLALGMGLVLVGSTLFAFAPGTPWLGWLLIIWGLVLIAVTLSAVGAGLKRTRYRRSVWRSIDTPLVIVSAGIIAITLAFKFIAPSLLTYDPFLRITIPPFDPLVAVAIAALGVPRVIVGMSVKRKTQNVKDQGANA